MTAAELMAELANDPEYQQMMREKQKRNQLLSDELAEDERGLLEECKAVGVSIESV